MNKTGIELIAEERAEQLTKHGMSVEQDQKSNPNSELGYAASYMAFPMPLYPADLDYIPDGWDKKIWTRMMAKDYRERLIIAGALVAAELDRINGVTYENS